MYKLYRGHDKTVLKELRSNGYIIIFIIWKNQYMKMSFLLHLSHKFNKRTKWSDHSRHSSRTRGCWQKKELSKKKHRVYEETSAYTATDLG